MVSYFSFLILIGNGNSFFVNNTVEVGNYFESGAPNEDIVQNHLT